MAHAPIIEVHEVFAQFEGLLTEIAGPLAADRSEAMAYSHCRSLLLNSTYRDTLPGFVVQCMSVFKYREFISLLDPSAAVRQDFVRASLAECRSLHARHRPDPIPRRSRPQEWTL